MVNEGEIKRRSSERLDEVIHEHVLPCGLRVAVIPKPGYQKKFAILATNYGSIDTHFRGGADEHQSPEGVAHFLEHKLFEDEAGDVFNMFARYGASANAWTSYTETAYHFTATSSFYDCLDLLLRFVATPYFTEAQIAKERKVIEQEIRMYEDSPDSIAHLNLLKELYVRHPIREDIPGTAGSIAEIDKAHLELCHRTFYHPSNMILAVSGDLDPSDVFDRAGARSSERAERFGAPAFERIIPPEPAELPAGERRVSREMTVSLPRVLIGSREEPIEGGPAQIRIQREVGFMLELVFGRSSAFFEERCRAGLIDDTFSYSFQVGRGGYAHMVLGGETPDPDGLVAAVDETFSKARDAGLNEDDFVRLRNKAYGRFLRGFNSPESIACGEADASMQGWDLLTYPELLNSIQLSDVERRLGKVFQPERRAVSIVRPLAKRDSQ